MNGGSRNLTIMVTAILVLVLVILGLEVTRGLPKIDEEPAPLQKTITVTGQGEVGAEPDLAMVILGVETRAESVGDTIQENSTIMETVREALAELGIADEDIQTTEFTVVPRRARAEEEENRIVGYTATNLIMVKIRGIDQVGEVLNRATAAGANVINSVIFTIEDPTVLQTQAREEAIADAINRAEETAQAAGIRLGDLVSITEFIGFSPTSQLYLRYVPAPAPAEIPISGGVLQVVVQVNATFAVEE